MNEFISNLNNVILKYVNDTELYDFGELSAIDSVNDLILSSRMPSFRDKIKNRFGLSKSLELSYEFFNTLGDNYGMYFLNRVNGDGIIYVYDPKGIDNASSFHIDGEKKIYFPYSKNICDSFAITHEMFHDMNLDVNNVNEVRNLYTEFISILGEMFFDDFISYNYDIKCCFNNRYTFNSRFLKAIKVRFYLDLIKCYLDNGYIDKFNFEKIISKYKYNSYYHNYLIKLVEDFISDNSFPIYYEYRYLLGILLSCYSKDLYDNHKFDINMFKHINENINNMIDEDIYDLLSLDVDDSYTLSLTSDSYDKLGRSYKKIMGKV